MSRTVGAAEPRAVHRGVEDEATGDDERHHDHDA